MKELLKSTQKLLADAEEKGRREADDRYKSEVARYNAEIAGLQKAKQEAIDYGNTEDAIKFERDLIYKQQPIAPIKPKTVYQPEVEGWFNDNKFWYGKAKAPTELLDVHMIRMKSDPRPFGEKMAEAMNIVSKAHPGYILEPKIIEEKKEVKPLVRPRSTSETSTPSVKTGKKYTITDIDAALRPFVQQASKAAKISISDYITEMKANER